MLINFRKQIIHTLLLSLVLLIFVPQTFSFTLSDQKILALKGDRNTQFKLGLFYQKGKNKDHLEAYYWMKMAAIQNHIAACRYVGRAHLYGNGTSVTIELAKKWFLTGANQGDFHSMLDLGYCLELERNWIESAAWYKIAHQFGNTNALKHLNNVLKNITNSEKDEIELLVTQIQTSISEEKKSSTSSIKPELQNSIKRIDLKNGYTYWGQIKNGIPHGYGKKKFELVTKYQGEFVMGLEHGYGTSFDMNGKISFQGLWEDGNPLPPSSKALEKDFTNY